MATASLHLKENISEFNDSPGFEAGYIVEKGSAEVGLEPSCESIVMLWRLQVCT